MLLVGQCGDTAFNFGDGWRTWCYSFDWTGIGAHRWDECKVLHRSWRCDKSIEMFTTQTVFVGIGQCGSIDTFMEHQDHGMHCHIPRYGRTSRWSCYHRFKSWLYEIGIGRTGSSDCHLGFDCANCGRCHCRQLQLQCTATNARLQNRFAFVSDFSITTNPHQLHRLRAMDGWIDSVKGIFGVRLFSIFPFFIHFFFSLLLFSYSQI